MDVGNKIKEHAAKQYGGGRGINPFKSSFSANRILPSSYLLWAGKRMVDYLLAKVHTTLGKVLDRLLQWSGRTNAKKKVSDRLLQRSGRTNAKKNSVGRHPTSERNGKIIMSDESNVGSERVNSGVSGS